MWVVILKFTEVGTRAIFVVLTAYSLGLAEAGQFGLVVTFQGLASFAFGYERHTDIQRRMAGQPDHLFDQTVTRALHLFGANYLWAIPLYVIALRYSASVSWPLIGLCVVIATAEQLMNQAYQMAMVNPRYRPLLGVAVVKNVVIVLGVVMLAFGPLHLLTLSSVLSIWAGVSGAGLAVTAYFWLSRRVTGPQDDTDTPLGLWAGLKPQYKASWTHFMLGLVAIVTLQIDRLVLGVMLPLDQVGIYFRHVLLVSMVYQVFNIAFYNRILPGVFATARTQPPTVLRPIVGREFRRVVGFVVLVGLAGLAMHLITGGAFAEQYHLQPIYFLGLLVMSAVRMRADLYGLIFNALHRERTIFQMQLLSFTLALPLLVGLTYAFAIPGIIAAGICSALLYVTFTALALRRLIREAADAN
jgi:O-antigen/teichoic acid export membrane protein